MIPGIFLMFQQLPLRASSTGSPGSIPGQEIRSHMPHATTKTGTAT